MVREVAESCVDSLLIEMVSSYADRFYATKPDLAARRIEAIGYQVGHQLSERKKEIEDGDGGGVTCFDWWLMAVVLEERDCEIRWWSVVLEEGEGVTVVVSGFEGGKMGRLGCTDTVTDTRTVWVQDTSKKIIGYRYTMERPRFSDHLEAIKFICKDFWSEIFKKQIDNLKTNHRGTFVLQDNRFRWLSHISIDSSPESPGVSQDGSEATVENKAAQAASMHLYFPCGIIRGALTNLGIPCAVSADISNLPACKCLF
ncbi:Trafficking protein particle complex subunit 6B [Bienertia sinuspersici]